MYKKNNFLIIGLFIFSSLIVVLFQNCSNKGFSSISSASTSPEGMAAPPEQLALTSVVSRKKHNLEYFDIPIDASKLITSPILSIEPRADIGGHTLVFRFDKPITSVATTTVVNSQNQVVGTATSILNGPDVKEVTVNVTGIPNQLRAKVVISGLNGGAASASASLGFLVGDVDGSGLVNSADTLLINNLVDQPINEVNFKHDLDLSASITSGDSSNARARQTLDLIFEVPAIASIAIPAAPYVKLSDSPFLPMMNNIKFANFKEYAPQYPLYSDNATKRRFIYLPTGQSVNTTVPDAWTYPQGTIFWKEFSVAGKKIETRVWEKTAAGSGMAAWRSSVYVWKIANASGDQTEADLLTVDDFYTKPLTERSLYQAGLVEANYKMVRMQDCATCHRGSNDSALGFNYLQLSKQSLISNIFNLGARNYFSSPPLVEDTIKGTQKARDAMGYIQSNCASCHSPLGNTNVPNFKHTSSTLLYANETILLTNAARLPPRLPLITFGDLPNSLIHLRLSNRTMPRIVPIAVDPAGVKLLEDWILEPQ